MLHESIVSFIFSPPDLFWLNVLQIVFIGFSVLFVAVIIFLGIFRTEWLRFKLLFDAASFLGYKPAGARRTQRQWEKIVSRLETGLESEYKLAVIEADSMLDDILLRMNLKGETFGERLKQLPVGLLSSPDDVDSAHKIRNNIVHDPDYKLELEEVKKALDIYSRAFADLEIL